MKKAFGFLEANSNAQESIRILKGLLHGVYPDAKSMYPNTDETIRILKDSIRMPATPRTRTTTDNRNKTPTNAINLVLMLRMRHNEH